MNTIKLNNGLMIPLVGLGTNTLGKENHDFKGTINNDTSEIESALRNGYTLLDTAVSYRNESVIGLAVKRSGLDRTKVFLTSKIPGSPEYTETDKKVEETIQASLKALDTDYIDLYLIHHPWDNLEDIARVWKVLENYVDKGILKTIGVSNFKVEQLAYLLDHSRIKPAINQIESHPSLWQDDVIEFCQKNGVIVEAWSPIKKVSEETKAKLDEIGAKYNKSWAQIILAYQVQRSVVVIPKSTDSSRQKLNLELFDFKLSDTDKAIIKTL
jgi:diketogulonate reductase-like aldo/keto reductase